MSSFRSRSESARSGKARPNTASRGTGRARQRDTGRARGYQQRRPEQIRHGKFHTVFASFGNQVLACRTQVYPYRNHDQMFHNTRGQLAPHIRRGVLRRT